MDRKGQIKKYGVWFVLGVVIVSAILFNQWATADSISTFNNSLSIENLTFTGSQNITRYLTIPYNSLIVSATLNLTGQQGGFCYQESANTTSQTGIDGSCNLNYSGTYYLIGEWGSDAAELWDGDYATSADPSFDTPPYFFYINYSKPITASNVGSLWQVKNNWDTSPFVITNNYSIPSGCWRDQIQLRIETRNAVGNQWGNGFCYNGSSWNQIYNYSDTVGG